MSTSSVPVAQTIRYARNEHFTGVRISYYSWTAVIVTDQGDIACDHQHREVSAARACVRELGPRLIREGALLAHPASADGTG